MKWIWDGGLAEARGVGVRLSNNSAECRLMPGEQMCSYSSAQNKLNGYGLNNVCYVIGMLSRF